MMQMYKRDWKEKKDWWEGKRSQGVYCLGSLLCDANEYFFLSGGSGGGDGGRGYNDKTDIMGKRVEMRKMLEIKETKGKKPFIFVPVGMVCPTQTQIAHQSLWIASLLFTSSSPLPSDHFFSSLLPFPPFLLLFLFTFHIRVPSSSP